MGASQRGPIILRPARRGEAQRLVELARLASVFSAVELEVFADQVEQYFASGQPDAEDLAERSEDILVAEPAGEPGTATAFLHYWKSVLSVHTFEICWMAVHPQRLGDGSARALFSAAEHNAIALWRCSYAALETSSRADYARTRAFWEKMGMREVGSMPDYYGPGDSRVFYYKALAGD